MSGDRNSDQVRVDRVVLRPMTWMVPGPPFPLTVETVETYHTSNAKALETRFPGARIQLPPLAMTDVLDRDAIRRVSAFLAPGDVARFARTCRPMRNALVKQRLDRKSS